MKGAIRATEHDKKLLTWISLVLAVFIACTMVIRPLYIANEELQEQIRKNEAKIEELQRKGRQLPAVETENEEKWAQLAGICAQMYPVMDSQQLDRIVTDVMLGHGLTMYRLNIFIPDTPADLPEYFQSEGKRSNPDGKYGIYLAQIEVEAAGSTENVDRMIDELAESFSGIRIGSIEWEMGELSDKSNTGNRQRVRLKLYVEMYEEIHEGIYEGMTNK